MILSRAQYDALRISGRHEETRKPTRKRANLGRLKTTKPDGEIIEAKNFDGGCGVKVGDTREVKWREEKGDRPRGGLIVTAAHIERDGDGYSILWRIGAIMQDDYLLARGAGYTRNPEASIDPEASAPYSPDIERIVADELAAQREARKKRLAKIKDATAELKDDEDRRVRLKAAHIDKMADELAALLAEGEAA